MSKKGDITRKKILDVAKELFSKKGYSSVTMQDIRLACDMSRGGLYRHYASTEDIFAAIIIDEQEKAFSALENARKNEISAYLILKTFIHWRIDNILDSQNSIDNAISEFVKNSPRSKKIIIDRAENSLKILSELIVMSCEEGKLNCPNPSESALSIMCLLEGMVKHKELMQLSDEDVSSQLMVIEKILGGEI